MTRRQFIATLCSVGAFPTLVGCQKDKPIVQQAFQSVQYRNTLVY
jgi:hypothetical protein